jgi:hypothetical protein
LRRMRLPVLMASATMLALTPADMHAAYRQGHQGQLASNMASRSKACTRSCVAEECTCAPPSMHSLGCGMRAGTCFRPRTDAVELSDTVSGPDVHSEQGCRPTHHTSDWFDGQIPPALDTVRTSSLVISTRIVRLWVMGLVAPAVGHRSTMEPLTPSGAADAEMLSVMLPASKSSWTVGLVICSQYHQG